MTKEKEVVAASTAPIISEMGNKHLIAARLAATRSWLGDRRTVSHVTLIEDKYAASVASIKARYAHSPLSPIIYAVFRAAESACAWEDIRRIPDRPIGDPDYADRFGYEANTVSSEMDFPDDTKRREELHRLQRAFGDALIADVECWVARAVELMEKIDD